MTEADTDPLDNHQPPEDDDTTALALAVIVHDIRTPLGAVSATADLLADTDLDPRQRSYVETLRQAATALNDLATELLDQAGEVPLEPAAARSWVPGETVSSLAALFRPLADERHVRLVVERGDGLDVPARGDAQAVRRILTNLLDNAIKFTAGSAHEDDDPALGERGTVRLVVACSRGAPRRLLVSVHDDGPGIAAEELPNLFLPYRQGASGQRLRSGSGLGLWISRTLARRLGGTLEVESAPGHGTRFMLDVPCEPSGDVDEDASADETTPPDAPVPGLHVLVVDDNSVNRLLVTTFLESFGMTFKAVDGGPAALEAVEGERFDVLVMDLQMPGMDGVETALRLRERANGAELPIVALTAGMRPADTQRCRRARFSSVLGKPFAPADLLTALIAAADAEQGRVS